MRGNFTLESVLLTGSVLLFYLIGVPSFGMRDYLNRTFHAIQDTKTPFAVACLTVCLNIILNLILRRFMGARGLALATSLSSYVGSMTMFVLLRKRMGRLGMRRIAGELVKIVLATLVAAAVCILMNKLLPEAVGTLRVFVRLVIATAVSGVAYLATCLALRVRALNEMLGGLVRRGRR